VVAPASRGWSGFTLTENRNRSSVFAFVAFSEGKRIPLFLKMVRRMIRSPPPAAEMAFALLAAVLAGGPGRAFGLRGGANLWLRDPP